MVQIILCLLLLSPAGLRASESGWNTATTSHFRLYKENPAGRNCGSEMEMVFMTLRRDLRFLSDWADRTKVEVYLYGDKETYLAGKFAPPEWSTGIVRKNSPRGSEWSLALYEPFVKKTFAHELAHLYMASFFQSAPELMPFWLNEGLAAMMEKEVSGPVQPSYKGPKVANPIPLEEFFSQTGAPDPLSAGTFYAQAHSIVRFLKRGNSPFKFEKFCKELRDVGDLDRAFSGAYGFNGPEQLEKAWKKWASAKPGKK